MTYLFRSISDKDKRNVQKFRIKTLLRSLSHAYENLFVSCSHSDSSNGIHSVGV